MNSLDDKFGRQFDEAQKRIAKAHLTIKIASVVWTVFALGVFGTLVVVAVHFLRKIW